MKIKKIFNKYLIFIPSIFLILTIVIFMACDTSVNDDSKDKSNPPDNNTSVCGNGIVEAGEYCDDGGESMSCNSNCTLPVCGDGILNTTVGEQCDDGNISSGDGCSDSCQTE